MAQQNQPTLSELIVKRADFLTQIRQFFAMREVVEADVAIMSPYRVSSPFVDSLKVVSDTPDSADLFAQAFLHTSPEVSLKKLLALGVGDLFYLGKVFRADASGINHMAEFTMLEWYRLDYSLRQLIDEALALVRVFVVDAPLEQMTYAQAYQRFADVADIFTTTAAELSMCLSLSGISVSKSVRQLDSFDRDMLEQLVWTEVIEPALPDGCVVITEHPVRFSDMAKPNVDDPRKANRFELYLHRTELANGYEENGDITTLSERFFEDNSYRASLGKPTCEPDELFLKALATHFPSCCGVALGVDRLFKLAFGYQDIRDCNLVPLANRHIKTQR